MKQQVLYFVQGMLGKQKLRVLHIWLSRCFWGVFLYRLERGLYCTIGKAYKILRVPFIPLFNLIQAYANIDIHYMADVKGGIIVLHPSAGAVVSGNAIVGSNLTLSGGNIIGIRAGCKWGQLIVGSHCNMGANAVILGPIEIADHVSIGASACAVKDCLISNVSLIGVPAVVHFKNTGTATESLVQVN
jgi:serine O-acetyltransferase